MTEGFIHKRIRNALSGLHAGRVESVEQGADEQQFIVTFAHPISKGLSFKPFEVERVDGKKLYLRVPKDWVSEPIRITTGSTNIKIGTGHNDEGAWHRAVLIAKALYEAGRWDGVEEITINNPYDVHGRLMGVEPVTAHDLQLGVDYLIETQKLGTQVRIGRLIEGIRHREHERALRHLFLNGTTGEIIETANSVFVANSMSYHVRFTGGTFAWLHEAEIASEPLEAVEPRVVNREMIAVTAVCRDCGQQFDAMFRRATYVMGGMDSLLDYAGDRCPVCKRISANFWNTPEGKMITGVQPVVIINPRDTDEMPGAVITATGKEGERLHPAPCGYPEYLCICDPDDEPEDGIEDSALRRFLAEHGNDVAALQKSLIEITNLANELARENKKLKAINDSYHDKLADLQQRFLTLDTQVKALHSLN